MLELYQGRTVDLVAYGGTDSDVKNVLLNQDLAMPGRIGEICTSAKKLAQRIILKLFTDLGSKKYRPNYGTRFMYYLRTGQLQTTQDVGLAFTQAAALIREQLDLEDRTDETIPDDERLRSLQLLNVTFDSDRNLYLNVLIATRSETQFPVILPITASV